MTVNSYIELYTTVFGWLLYDGIWDILRDIGMLFLPFLGVLARSVFEALESHEEEAAIVSLKRMEVAVVSMLTVIVLAGQPFLPIATTGSTYTPPCGGTQVSGGNTDTTYDAAFASLGGKTAQVPVWWMAVMRISSGITNASIQAIPCGTDLRQLQYEINNESIQDPQTLRQVALFREDCWAPARKLWDTEGVELPKGADPGEIEWIGSIFLQGWYYDRRQASEAIPGFPFQATETVNGSATGRDSAKWNPKTPKPEWGYPVCNEWWNDPTNGLKARLLSEVDPATLDLLKAEAAERGVGNDVTENHMLRGLLASVSASSPVTYNAQRQGFFDSPTAALETAGAKWEQLSLIPKINLLKQAAPIVQSLILMLLYAVLPFVLLFSSYSISTVIGTSIILFAIRFLSVLWELAKWLDNALIKALELGRVSSNGIEVYNFMFGTSGLYGGIDSLQKDIIDLSLGILFMVAPLVWIFALGLAGLKVGREIGNLIDRATEPVRDAGDKAKAVGENAVKRTLPDKSKVKK